MSQEAEAGRMVPVMSLHREDMSPEHRLAKLIPDCKAGDPVWGRPELSKLAVVEITLTE